jgi:NAD(P)-dependent dehydrogenase (short-subunit alcohol dehydrogenase family)
VAGRLHDHVVFLTGGGSGIGRAVVERVLAEGGRICVLQRPGPRADDLRALGDRVLVVEGDVRSAGDQRRGVAAAVERFGRLDAAIANAGVWDFNTRLDAYGGDEQLVASFDELFDVNVKGALLTAAASCEQLRETRGSLIFTASSSSLYAGGGGPLYVASKHALHGLVRQLAFELAPEVRVNAIAAGATETPLRGPAALGLENTRLDGLDDFTSAAARQIPLGFVSAPEDHTDLFVLLASRSEARFVTAAMLPSDGGLEVRGGGRRRPPLVPSGVTSEERA